MSLAVVRRAATLGLTLVLVVAGTAFADQLRPDGDAVAGVQSSVDLGEVAPASDHSLDAAFSLTCIGSSHLPAGSSITVYPMALTSPDGGSMTVGDGAIHVPALWPADGADCTGSEPTATSTAASVQLTAPAVEGPATFVVLFALDSEASVSNTIALTVAMTVVAPTGDPGPDPDADPDPDPPAPPATVWTATWERPLARTTPALVAKASRTIPLKVALFADGEAMGPGGETPALTLERRAACDGGDVLEARPGGALRWADGRWVHQLDTASLSPGCWRVAVSVGAETVAAADILIVADGQGAAAHRR